MTRAEGRAQKKALWKEIAREERKKQRAELARLVGAVRAAKGTRRDAIRGARWKCRQARVELRKQLKERRRIVLEQLAENARAERAAAKEACAASVATAKGLSQHHERARGKLAAERAFRRDMRRIARQNKQRKKETTPRRWARERARESDDEVLSNIPADLVPLWRRVGAKIKGGTRWSRTEAFLHYAEEHPSEVLAALDDRTDALVRDLERQERSARAALRRGVPRRRRAPPLDPTGTDDVPF